MLSGMLDRTSEIQSAKDWSDPVSELLHGMRLRGASYGRFRLAPPFGIRFAAGREARFHFVAAGDLFRGIL